MIKNTWNRIGTRFIDHSFLLHEYIDYEFTRSLRYTRILVDNNVDDGGMEISVDNRDDGGGESVPVDK